MTAVTEDRVLDVLKGIDGPEGGDIVSLGWVQGLAIKDGNVAFALEVPRDKAPTLEPLRKRAEASVLALEGVTSATAVLTAHRAPSAATSARPGQAPAAHGHGEAATGRGPAAGKVLVPGVAAIVAVASGKGGVGKSTTATNLALGLARLGLSVGMLDADIYGPSQPRMLGISGRPTSPDGKRLVPLENYGIKCMSMGFLVAEDTPMIWRGPMVQSALTQMLRDVEWGALDVMIVDMPPGTGDAQLTMAQQVPLAGAVIVSTPQDIALIDARKGLNMFRKVDVPVFGIVENMSVFVCPHCGKESHIFAHGGARAEAARLGVPFLGEIPLDIAIRETSDGGRPLVVSAPDSPQAKAYMKIAEGVRDRLRSATQRQAPKIVMQ